MVPWRAMDVGLTPRCARAWRPFRSASQSSSRGRFSTAARRAPTPRRRSGPPRSSPLRSSWSRGRFGAVALPRLDRAGLVAAATAVGLVAWGGLTIWWSIAGDRSWDALAKGLVVLAFGVVGLAAAAVPGRPLRTLALVLAALLGAVFVWALLGKAVPALGPGRRRPRRPAEGLDRLLERARAPRRTRRSPRPLARRRIPRPRRAAVPAPLLSLRRDGRAPPHPVPRRDRRGIAVVALALALSDDRVEAAAARPPRDRSGSGGLGLGLHAARPRRGRRCPRRSCRGRPRPRRASRGRRGGVRRARPARPRRPPRRDAPTRGRPRARRRHGARRGRRPAGLVARGRQPVLVGGRPVGRHRRGRQRSRPARQPRDEQPHRLVGRGVAGVPRQSGGRHRRADVRDRAQAYPRQRRRT